MADKATSYYVPHDSRWPSVLRGGRRKYFESSPARRDIMDIVRRSPGCNTRYYSGWGWE